MYILQILMGVFSSRWWCISQHENGVWFLVKVKVDRDKQVWSYTYMDLALSSWIKHFIFPEMFFLGQFFLCVLWGLTVCLGQNSSRMIYALQNVDWQNSFSEFQSVNFERTFLLSSNSSKKLTKQFNHSTVRQKNRICSFFFGRIISLKKTLHYSLTFS